MVVCYRQQCLIILRLYESLSLGSKQLFLSHDWGQDAPAYTNHQRVKRIAEELERRGFTVWLDEQQMIGSVVDRMAQGIDSCEVCVVFVTANYMRKVNQDDA